VSDHYDLWSFHIRGGRDFTFQHVGNPSVVHDGGVTVFHLVLTKTQAEEIKDVIEYYGCEILDARTTEVQSEEQKVERDRLRGIGQENKVWPTVRCPECFWFDPTLEDDPCGYVMWTVEMIGTALDAHRKARIDVQRCPRLLKDIAGIESLDSEH